MDSLSVPYDRSGLEAPDVSGGMRWTVRCADLYPDVQYDPPSQLQDGGQSVDHLT